MINLNSDLGEGAGNDEGILRSIDSANLGCGVHAAGPGEVIRVARLCADAGVEVGAHPGYDDREHFGREEAGIDAAQLEALVRFQVAALMAVAPVTYVKAHGALYHRCQADAAAAAALARVAVEFGLALMGQPGMGILAAAESAGVRGLREGFADRAYLPDGRLMPRSQPGSLLGPDEAAAQAVRLAREGTVDSICVHGDSPGAVETAAAVRAAFRQAGIETGPLVR